jgi:hypothetical protein
MTTQTADLYKKKHQKQFLTNGALCGGRHILKLARALQQERHQTHRDVFDLDDSLN